MSCGVCIRISHRRRSWTHGGECRFSVSIRSRQLYERMPACRNTGVVRRPYIVTRRKNRRMETNYRRSEQCRLPTITYVQDIRKDIRRRRGTGDTRRVRDRYDDVSLPRSRRSRTTRTPAVRDTTWLLRFPNSTRIRVFAPVSAAGRNASARPTASCEIAGPRVVEIVPKREAERSCDPDVARTRAKTRRYRKNTRSRPRSPERKRKDSEKRA